MEEILKNAIKRYCGSRAYCEKYVEGAIKNLKPEIKVAYKCTCNKKRI